MSIKYRNQKGLNERKSNQSSLQFHEDYYDDLLEQRFGEDNQERIESIAEDNLTSNEVSFDKYPRELKSNLIGEKMKEKEKENKKNKKSHSSKVKQMDGMNIEDPSNETLTQTLDHNSRKHKMEKEQKHKPRDNA